LEAYVKKAAKSVNVHDARTHFSSLLARVEKGQEFVIARAGKPVARLVPTIPERSPPIFGADRGAFTVPDDFDSPLLDEILDAFEGKRR
jgi:prevent-host-death family protein